MDDGEVSDQDSVEEISGCDFKPCGRDSMKRNSSMMMMISVGDEGYCVSGNAAASLFSLAWAQAVQGKQLNGLVDDGRDSSSGDEECGKGSEVDPMVVEEEEAGEKEEGGESEDGEIDFEVTEEMKSGGEKAKGAEMEVDVAGAGAEAEAEAETEEVVWIRQMIEKVTPAEAERSFRFVCQLLKLSLRRLGQVFEQCGVLTRDSLVGKTVSAIRCVCTVFNCMSPVLKEQNRSTISTLLSYAFTMEPDLFSVEQKMEVEASMVTVESSAIEEGTKVSEHPEELPVIDYAILTNAIALPVIEKATVTDSSAPPAGANNNLVSFEKYNSDQSVDPENWEVMSGNLAIHPYEAVAIRAVSSYQHNFSRSMFSSGDRLPSPTPSGEDEPEGADETRNKVTCFRTSDISTVPHVQLQDIQLSSSNIISSNVPESITKSSNAVVSVPVSNPPSRPFAFTNSKIKNRLSSSPRSKLDSVSEALSLKNSMIAVVPSVGGPALKKQRTGPETSFSLADENGTQTSSRSRVLENESLLCTKRGGPPELVIREPKKSPIPAIDLPSVISNSTAPISSATLEKPNRLAPIALVPSPAALTVDHSPFQNECSGAQHSARVEAHLGTVQGVKENQDSPKFANGAESSAALSQTVVFPDMAKSVSGSLENIDGINRQTVTSSKCGEGVVPSRSRDSWEGIEHVLGRYNDQEQAVIQRERARRIEEQKKMLAARKLSLVLDLDHTLLNSAMFSDIDPELDEILRIQEEHDRKRSKRHLFRFSRLKLWTKLRPGIWTFLEKASKLYELHLCTMGNKSYANEIVKVLDPTGALFAGRVISQEVDRDHFECEAISSKCKDLDGVMGMESAVIIIDDTVCVWPNNKPNLMTVDPYIFFPSSRRQLGRSGASLLERGHDERPEDNALASALAVIERIHHNFFSNRPLHGVDVRNILAYEKRKILGGCRIVFSGVFPLDERKPHHYPLWRIAEEFGAVCTKHFDEQVTHVVAMNPGTDKVKRALSTRRHVVSKGW
ncbi:hypothetical protein Droror1_Dr00018404 [Drosera rotundifolia]